MTLCFTNMPLWVIVASVSQIARQVQGAVAVRPELQCEAVDAAIQMAEESARYGRADERASELADKARKVAEEASNDNQPNASHAAVCAAEAARMVSLTTDRQGLVFTAQRALDSAREALRPECLADFEADVEQVAQLGCGLTDSDPVPPEMLGFVHYQAVHEAGHAVAACRLGILFDTVRIIYNAGVDFVRNPIDDPEQVIAADRRKYHLGYAAGLAAEDLVIGGRREWGCAHDRHNHEKCGGTDFDGDATEVQKYGWFSKRALLKVASLLEDRRTLSDREVHRVLNELQG